MHPTRILALAAIATGLATQLGCEALGELGVQVPEAAINRVDLLSAPSAEELAFYGCGEALGEGTCATFGVNSPPKKQLQFSFDLVFDVSNPNLDIPIPMVETLLGFTAFDTANLGSVCVSFCDPGDESCQPTQNADGACNVDESQDVDEPTDLIPTVDELVLLAEDVAAEGLEGLDNDAWRVIEPGTATEAHIVFDLGIDPMLQISDELLLQAVDQVLLGEQIQLDVPYTVEGTLFFDVPTLNKYAVGFGPFDDDWRIKP